MAKGYNKAMIMGNLARDPEIRYTSDKRAVGNFTVAVNRVWKDKNGEKQEGVDFIPVVVWGPMAENCERYLKKGSGVFVEGRIQVRNYEAKDGTKRYVTEILASDMTFLPSSKNNNAHAHDDDNGYDDSETRSRNKKGGGRAKKDEFDDNEPFDMSSARADDDDGENSIPF